MQVSEYQVAGCQLHLCMMSCLSVFVLHDVARVHPTLLSVYIYIYIHVCVYTTVLALHKLFTHTAEAIHFNKRGCTICLGQRSLHSVRGCYSITASSAQLCLICCNARTHTVAFSVPLTHTRFSMINESTK